MLTQSRFIIAFLLAITQACALAQPPASPAGLTATGYEQHIDLTWQPSPEPNVTGYKIYRSTDGGASFSFLKQVGKQTLASLPRLYSPKVQPLRLLPLKPAR